MAISEKTTKELYSRSAGLCNICKEFVLNLVYDSVVHNGERCHIKGKREGAARYIKQVGEDNSYHNLILLCPIHHIYIDSLEESFSVPYLLDIKRQHERAIASNPYLQNNADIELINGIFKIFPMMYYYGLVRDSDPKKIPIAFLDILHIEVTLVNKYGGDYPFQHPMLKLHTETCFYNLKKLRRFLVDDEIYKVPGSSEYFHMVTSLPPEKLVEIYKYFNLFHMSFSNWYTYSKKNFVY